VGLSKGHGHWVMCGGRKNFLVSSLPLSKPKYALSMERVNISGGSWYFVTAGLGLGLYLINLLTPELNPSAQRCLPRFFTGILIFKEITA
jgi:hypothetical protein